MVRHLVDTGGILWTHGPQPRISIGVIRKNWAGIQLKNEPTSLRNFIFCATVMSKVKFTEADVKRAVKGVIDGGGIVANVEIWPDGRISVKVKEDKHRSLDPEDDPAVSRKLL
jgi:hypothetical protein